MPDLESWHQKISSVKPAILPRGYRYAYQETLDLRNMIIPRLLLMGLLLQPLATAFFLSTFSKAQTAVSLIDDLEKLIQKAETTLPSPEMDEDVKSLMTDISESRMGDQRRALPGRWELIFTTEKEVNFFKTSWPFAKVRSITQDIDPYTSCTIKNLIRFEGGGEFAVRGIVAPADSSGAYDRVEFKFQGAVIRGWGREVKVPPVGAGWFDTMFCDDNLRLSRDSRGDWSVFRKIKS